MTREMNPRVRSTKSWKGEEGEADSAHGSIKLNRNEYAYHIVNPEKSLLLCHLLLVHRSYPQTFPTLKLNGLNFPNGDLRFTRSQL